MLDLRLDALAVLVFSRRNGAAYLGHGRAPNLRTSGGPWPLAKLPSRVASHETPVIQGGKSIFRATCHLPPRQGVPATRPDAAGTYRVRRRGKSTWLSTHDRPGRWVEGGERVGRTGK